MWPEQDRWRAPPVGDFPPRWASAFGDDAYGLWADLAVGEVVQRMRWIEPSGPEGFGMGSSQKERDAIKDKDVRQWANSHESEPRSEVVAGFWLADTPCTQALWQAVMGGNPSDFRKGADAPQRPVEQVYVETDVPQFFKKLQTLLPAGCVPELPREAQWEYAARAGTQTAYWWGDAPDASRANWDGNQKGTTPVKRYPANPWGLYDVHGNVWEWCADAWRQRLDAPNGKEDGEARVVRGGSWLYHPGGARSAYRRRGRVGYRNLYLGFRFLLRSSSPAPGGRESPAGVP